VDRLNHELGIIADEGYSGYFLIVQDFTDAARELDVRVGPGRGSAAGSCVSYCLGITNVDPLEYDLLFERFLNPERVSMPDIDIDRYAKAPPQAEADVDRRFDRFERALPPGIDRGPSCVVQKR
ncbi:DNA polymerase III alpha subunit, partial [Salinibacter ruber]|nr:DNA polymerase III alpha subunit [Salinibacter ruber]